MAFTLEEVVPWGRSLDEYRRMFRLGNAAETGPVLGCGDGPASFNAEWTAEGGRAVAVDPLYQFSGEAIAKRFAATRPVIMAQTRAHREQFVWEYFASPDELEAARVRAAQKFFEDYEFGVGEGRYIAASLPNLPFAEKHFQLALCSHFLFLYAEHLDVEFHLSSLREMLRVAREVRVFPLLGLNAKTSPHLEPVCAALADECKVAVEKVDYEFQRGGNLMLRLTGMSHTDAFSPART